MELPVAITSVIDAAIEFTYGLGKYAEPTVVLGETGNWIGKGKVPPSHHSFVHFTRMLLEVPPFVKLAVQNLSEAIGFDVETLSYVLGLFLCYPLGMILNSMPFGMPRHFFSFFLGAFLLQFTIGLQWIHQLVTSLAVYAMFVVVPRDKIQLVVPVFVMFYMTMGHLHRQYINYLGWDMDFTGSQMVSLTLLHSTYCGKAFSNHCCPRC